MRSLKGSFLISSPGLADPNFSRTVVFMAEHNDEGAFGLVLSRPTSTTLLEISRAVFGESHDLPPEELLRSIGILAGGPVQNSAVFFLHTHESPGKDLVEPGLYLGSQATELEEILDHLQDANPPRLRVFFGYSGWSSGQLEREIRAGGWLARQATLDQVFDPDSENLWRDLISSFGGDLGILGSAPANPELN